MKRIKIVGAPKNRRVISNSDLKGNYGGDTEANLRHLAEASTSELPVTIDFIPVSLKLHIRSVDDIQAEGGDAHLISSLSNLSEDKPFENFGLSIAHSLMESRRAFHRNFNDYLSDDYDCRKRPLGGGDMNGFRTISFIYIPEADALEVHYWRAGSKNRVSGGIITREGVFLECIAFTLESTLAEDGSVANRHVSSVDLVHKTVSGEGTIELDGLVTEAQVAHMKSLVQFNVDNFGERNLSLKEIKAILTKRNLSLMDGWIGA